MKKNAKKIIIEMIANSNIVSKLKGLDTIAESDVKDLYKEYVSEENIDDIDFSDVTLQLEQYLKEEEDQTISVDDLLKEADLDETFVQKAKIIFDTAVSEKVKKEAEKITTLAEQYIEEKVAEETEILEDEVSKYADYIAEQFIEENKLVIESEVKVEAAEKILESAKEILESSGLEIEESKIDHIKELEEKLKIQEEMLNKEIASKNDLSEEIKQLKKKSILDELTENMADTQKEKFSVLTEDIEFVDDEEYKNKMSIIKEEFFKHSEETVNEEVDEEKIDEEVNEENDLIASALKVLKSKY